jgi:hypothetical protein
MGSGGKTPPFLASALDGNEGSASRPARLTPGTHCIGRWVGPKAGLNAMEKREILPFPEIERRPADRPVALPT